MLRQHARTRPAESPGKVGVVQGINGPVVRFENAGNVGMGEVVDVGRIRLLGEVIRLEGKLAIVQVYEPTEGLQPGEPVYGTGTPLSVELGPGMVGSIFD